MCNKYTRINRITNGSLSLGYYCYPTQNIYEKNERHQGGYKYYEGLLKEKKLKPNKTIK